MASYCEFYICFESGGYYMNSMIFYNIADAREAYTYLSKTYPDIHFDIVLSNQARVLSPNEIGLPKRSITRSGGTFTGMTVMPYGRGYILVPPEDHSDTGTKYYHNGWWMPTKNAWFFKKEYYKSLINNGATMEDA